MHCRTKRQIQYFRNSQLLSSATLDDALEWFLSSSPSSSSNIPGGSTAIIGNRILPLRLRAGPRRRIHSWCLVFWSSGPVLRRKHAARIVAACARAWTVRARVFVLYCTSASCSTLVRLMEEDDDFRMPMSFITQCTVLSIRRHIRSFDWPSDEFCCGTFSSGALRPARWFGLPALMMINSCCVLRVIKLRWNQIQGRTLISTGVAQSRRSSTGDPCNSCKDGVSESKGNRSSR